MRLLTDEEVFTYHRDGFLLVKSFYDVQKYILPIQVAIRKIITLVRASHGLPNDNTFESNLFDHLYLDTISASRDLGGIIYDAVKQIPAFVRLVSSLNHELIYKQLVSECEPGVAASGYGIRIDNPNEERYRADWHQDYLSQLRSLDGAVFWSPLVPIDPVMGPVELLAGSHHDGLSPVTIGDPNHPEKTGAYGVILKDREDIVARYTKSAPVTYPGDLLLIDFKTIHASGYNKGSRARWSMQSRLFNFNCETGKSHNWSGSFATGRDFSTLHPELITGVDMGSSQKNEL